MGLVARRVWSKRGILVGSLLGATLVTALLTIVPLYEASVQAVDLLFTVRGATSDTVDVTAFVNYNDYLVGVAEGNREVVNERADALLAKWYPDRLERTQSREFIVIPLNVDWYGQAEAWREALQIAMDEGEDPRIGRIRPIRRRLANRPSRASSRARRCRITLYSRPASFRASCRT